MDEIAVFSHLTTILTTKNGPLGARKNIPEYSKKPVNPRLFKDYRLLSKSGGGGIRTHGPC